MSYFLIKQILNFWNTTFKTTNPKPAQTKDYQPINLTKPKTNKNKNKQTNKYSRDLVIFINKTVYAL